MGCTYTIPEGSQTAVLYRSGKVKVVTGPANFWRCRRKFENLERYVASEGEYLLVKFKDGKVELVPGPVCVFKHPLMHEDIDISSQRFVATEDEYLLVKCKNGKTQLLQGPIEIVKNPLEHESITLKQATKIGEQELIVVYKPRDCRDGGAAEVKRELVRGPSIYVPSTVSEWMHAFSWTGTSEPDRDPNSKAVKRVNGLKFTKLRTNPGKTYIDVDNVRTKDNALVTVKTMVFFRYVNVEMMLDNTNDVFGDMMNAISADIIEWCAPMVFDEFILKTDALNTLGPYAQLCATAAKIGMDIEKVVFRGYTAPVSLQRLHDGAIEKRTAMALAKEQEEEEQRLADFKLQRESQREEENAKLEMARAQHEINVKRVTSQAEQKRREEEIEVELKRLREIKAIDRNADIGTYLLARDCQLPTIVQCGTLMNGQGASADKPLHGALRQLVGC